MDLNIDQTYNLVMNSLENNPQDWTWSDHYRRYSRGIGLPYTIENKEFAIEIWLANGWASTRMKIQSRFETSNGRPRLISGSDLPNVSIFKRIKLYRACHRVIKGNGAKTKWKLPISKRMERDIKLNELLDEDKK